ncbi:MAG: hypothetical protein PVF86_16140 [Desulfobacterales bacterium]|jgi:hypothetical protein
MIRIYLEPRVVIKWEDFINTKPRFSIALDGYVKGPPRFLIQGPYANFNHHEGVARIATRSTCAQVYYYIRLGLLETFQKNGKPYARVYINDVDQDVCLSCWLLKNSEKLEGLRFDHLLVQMILFEDILDASAGAYPVHPDNPQIHRQAWIYEPYTQARSDGSIHSLSKKEMKAILHSVCARIDAAIDGRSEKIELDTRYKKIGGGPGWQMIHEEGPYARTKLFAQRIKAYVALVESRKDRYTYTIGKMSPFVMFPVERIYDALNKAEGLTSQDDCWGGSTIIGGSPRKTGSRLTPQKVQKVINDCIKREQRVRYRSQK